MSERQLGIVLEVAIGTPMLLMVIGSLVTIWGLYTWSLTMMGLGVLLFLLGLGVLVGFLAWIGALSRSPREAEPT